MRDGPALQQRRGGRHRNDPASTSQRSISRRRAVWASASVGALVTVGFCAVITGAMGGHDADPVAVPTTAASSGVSAPEPIPPPPTSPHGAPDTLDADFAQLRQRVHGVVAVAISAVGAGADPRMLGDWPGGPAWSTIKVPLAIAALRETNQSEASQSMTAAITESDTAAAESLWDSLGDPSVAAQKVEAVLREAGDQTEVQSQRVRPPFTAFGQTIWSLTAQARFLSYAVCDSRDQPIFALMGRIAGNQSWGLGHIAGTRFKGGWGPKPTGEYLIRQIGVIPTPSGLTAVSMAIEPASGSMAEGTEELTEVANWLSDHLSQLPSGHCGS